MTLTEFLLARIAEDEGTAEDALERGFGGWEWLADCGINFEARTHITRHHPARVLAECVAKRRIVDLHDGQGIASCASCYYDDYESGLLPADWPCSTIKALALPYADHPDYRAEWKP